MSEPELVAVKATEKRFRVLKHEPTGSSLDEHGEGFWPPDSFTYRLRNEGSIRIVEPDEAKAPSKAAARRRKAKGPTKKPVAPLSEAAVAPINPAPLPPTPSGNGVLDDAG